ncbi:MAG: S8 family serine peptidase, partial [Candidatus Dadabacteria bacterium]|nr:S8 family serine peptidase [Candidatus Dadabacteria bacterium]
MNGGKPLAVALSFCAVFTAGCFGGGGGGDSPQVLGPDTRVIPDMRVTGDPVLPVFVRSPGPGVVGAASLQMFYDDYFSTSGVRDELAQVNASRAYANIHMGVGPNAAASPGGGTTIGFVDSGLDAGNPAFSAAGKVAAVVDYFGTATSGSDLVGGYSHGTQVAGIAAGVRAPLQLKDTDTTVITEGVAPGANVSMFAFRAPGGSASSLRAAILGALGDPDVDIVNVSIEPGEPFVTNPAGVIKAAGFWEGTFPDEYYQRGVSDSAKKVIVWAAGNMYGEPCEVGVFSCSGGKIVATNPSIYAGLPIFAQELRDFWTIVVAVNAAGTIADFSNRCGVAAPWCIAAPGDRVNAPSSKAGEEDPVRRAVSVNGTSFAAPIVSGGLALMKQQFPGMSNIQLLQRMYATANDEGIYDDEATYGHGLLDLGAATEPVGDTLMVLGEDLGEGSLRDAPPVYATNLETTGAFGDGITTVFTGVKFAAFDSLGAPFWYPLEQFAPRAEVSHIRRRMSGFMEFASASPSERRANRRDRSVPVSGGATSAGLETEGQIPSVYFSRGAADIEDRDLLGKEGHLSYITAPEFAGFEIGGFSAYAFTSPEWAERRGHGAVVSWGPFRSGFVSEPRSALGAVAEGAFGGLSSELGFAGLGWEWERGGWRFVADVELGASGAGAGDGLISGVSRL